MPSFEEMPEKWRKFLEELDAAATAETRLDCMGGFAVTQWYGFSRETIDLDALVLAPRDQSDALLEKARKGSQLHKTSHLYLDYVAWAKVPENYEDRLAEMFAGHFRYLRLCVLDPYDLALAKLERNEQRDRDDVKYLARTIPLDPAVLKARYEKELRWQMGIPEREDLTMKLWLEMIAEEQQSRR